LAANPPRRWRRRTTRAIRTFRTGRNVQFSCNVKQEMEDESYQLTDELTRRVAEQGPDAH